MSLLLLFSGNGIFQPPAPPIAGTYKLVPRVHMVPNNYGPSRRGAWLGPRVLWQLEFVPSTQGQVFTTTVNDALDVMDDFLKNHANQIAETGDVADAIVKNLAFAMSEQGDLFDAISKALSTIRDDSIDVSDAVLLYRLLALLLSEAQDVRDEQVKSMFPVMNDSAVSQDVLTKLLSVARDDSVSVVDSVDLNREIVLLLADALSIADEYVKSLLASISDSAFSEDAFTKILSSALSDALDISDDAVLTKLVALIVLDAVDMIDIADEVLITKFLPIVILDTIDLVDGMTKLVAKVAGDDSLIQDEITKSLYAAQSDSVALSDVVSVNKSISVIISEVQDIVDGMTKLQAMIADESVSSTEEFTKTMAKVLADFEDVSDSLYLVRFKTLDDSVTLADALDAVRQLILVVQEVQDILESIIKSVSATMAENQSAVFDAVVKSIFSALSEQVDLTDQVAVSRVISIVLQEIQDVADDMVKAISTVMDDPLATEDTLVKLIYKVLSEDQEDISDDVTLSVIRAIIIIAEYLDSRLGGTHDLMNRVAGNADLIRRVSKNVDLMDRSGGTKDVGGRTSKITDLMGRSHGTKGHKR